MLPRQSGKKHGGLCPTPFVLKHHAEKAPFRSSVQNQQEMTASAILAAMQRDTRRMSNAMRRRRK